MSINLEVQPSDAKKQSLNGETVFAARGDRRLVDLLKARGSVAKLAIEHGI